MPIGWWMWLGGWTKLTEKLSAIVPDISAAWVTTITRQRCLEKWGTWSCWLRWGWRPGNGKTWVMVLLVRVYDFLLYGRSIKGTTACYFFLICQQKSCVYWLSSVQLQWQCYLHRLKAKPVVILDQSLLSLAKKGQLRLDHTWPVVVVVSREGATSVWTILDQSLLSLAEKGQLPFGPYLTSRCCR